MGPPRGCSAERIARLPKGKIMNALGRWVKNFLQAEDGPTAVEYAVMLALIIVVCLASIQAIGNSAKSTFDTVNTSLS